MGGGGGVQMGEASELAAGYTLQGKRDERKRANAERWRVGCLYVLFGWLVAVVRSCSCTKPTAIVWSHGGVRRRERDTCNIYSGDTL